MTAGRWDGEERRRRSDREPRTAVRRAWRWAVYLWHTNRK